MLTDGRPPLVTDGESPRPQLARPPHWTDHLPTLPHALVAAVAAVVFLVVFALSGWWPLGVRLDTGILVHFRVQGDPNLLWIVSVPWLILCCIVVAVISVRRGRVADGVRALAILAVCNVLGQVLKKLVLERESLVLSVDNTYPSGHMIAFGSVAVALWIVLPPQMRRVYGIIAGIVLAVVAFELVRYGWHRPSDVIGSICLITAVSALGWRTHRGTGTAEDADPASPDGHAGA